MGRIQRFAELFDEHNEIAAWLVLITAVVLLLLGKLEQWPFVALVGLGLVTLLGSKYFAGVRVGPSGVEVEK